MGDTPEPEFTAAERARVRELLRAEDRWAWLRSTIRAWALAVAAVVTGATIGIEALRRLLRKLMEP